MTWKTVKLKEVISHRKGFIEIDDEEDYKLVTVKLHRKGVYLRENLKGFQIRTKKQQVCKAGDFIVAEMDAKVGGYGFIPDYLEGAIVSSHYFLFEVNEEKLRPQFLEVVSQLKILQDQIKAVGSTNYAAIRAYNVLDWEIPLPPIEKQIEIENLYLVAKEKVDNLNLEFADQLTQLENLNQAILQEAVQGKLVAQDKNDEPASELLKRIKAERQKSLPAGAKRRQEKPLPPIKPDDLPAGKAGIPFDIPDNWVWCRLGEICEILGGFAFDSTRYSKIETQNQVIRLGNVKPNQLVLETSPVFIDDDYAQEVEKSILKENDILITMTGTKAKRDYLFTLCLSANDLSTKRLFLNQRVGCFRFDSFIFPEYINVAMKDLSLLSPVFDSSTGAANQANIGMGALKEILIPLPPLSEQKRIVAEIEKQFAKTKQLKELITQNQQATGQLLKALLHQAFLPAQEPRQAGEAREVEEV